MATRLNKRQTEGCREAIKTTQLLNRLQKFANGEKENGSDKLVELSPAQIRAMEILLNKSLPNLSSVEMNANITQSHESALDELAGEDAKNET